MSIMTDLVPVPAPVSHPRWCDPRVCASHRSYVRHSCTPVSWGAERDDVVVTATVTRDDERGRDGVQRPDQTGITLALENLASCNRDGSPIAADVFLTAADARRLAADLLVFAGLADEAALESGL